MFFVTLTLFFSLFSIISCIHVIRELIKTNFSISRDIFAMQLNGLVLFVPWNYV